MDKKLQLKNKELKEQIKSLNRQIKGWEAESAWLRKQKEKLEKKLLEIPGKLNEIILDAKIKGEEEKEIALTNTLKDLLREKEEKTILETQIVERERIIDEMAHTINSDVHISVSYLSRIIKNNEDPKLRTTLYHVKQIRDLINLIMLYLKRKEIIISQEKDEISLKHIILTQLNLVKESLSTLRLSTEEHEANLIKLNPILTLNEDGIITISKDWRDVPIVIIKDLLRNALKNTKENHPIVKINLDRVENGFKMEIQNNKCISESFVQWFNEENTKEPEMSKSTKVGLRVIKMWAELLGIKVNFQRDIANDTTTAIVLFPKELIYDSTT